MKYVQFFRIASFNFLQYDKVQLFLVKMVIIHMKIATFGSKQVV
jgi:hypothetical protein